jgi:hypothetical protein
MTKNGLVAAGVRLFAIFLVVVGVRQIGAIVVILRFDSPSIGQLAITALIVGFPLVLAGFLWVFAGQISRRIAPELNDKEEAERLGEIGWFSVGSVLLGLYLVATAGSGLIYWSAAYYRSHIRNDLLPDLLAQLFLLGLGLILILGVSGITKLYWYLKWYGVASKEASNK